MLRLRLRLLTVALLLAGPLAMAAPRDLTVDAGSLRARIEPDPWRLVFTDSAGALVLVEHATPLGDAPGPLGVRTAAGWVYATRVVEARRRGRRRLRVVAETSAGDDRRLEVDVSTAGEDVIAVGARLTGAPAGDVAAWGVGFDAEPDERFFGFGERANAVDQRGEVVESYVADGPYQENERDVVARFVPAPGFRARDDATYFPMPWLLSSRGIGVLVDVDETSYFRLGTPAPTAWSVEVTGALVDAPGSAPPPDRLAFRVFAGPTPAEALARFSRAVGRQPPPGAPWVLGPWVQLTGPLEQRLEQLATLRAAGGPVSVVQTYTHYLPCGDHVGREDSERALVNALHAAGVAVTTYFNPMLCESYEPRFSEAVAAGALTRTATGAPYVYDYTGSTIFRVGQFDFTAPAGRRFFDRLLQEAIAAGYDGWMEDFGEYTPLDAVDAAGRTGSAHHNRHAMDYHCAAWDSVRRARRPVVRFQRSGWTGAARCAQVVWNGDPTTGWGFDGLTSAVWGGLNMGLSGVALWGSDVGGFFALGDNALTPELLVRWVQFGAVSGVMRTQANGFALPPKVRPQVFDPPQLANWARYASLRTQLFPYLAAAADAYRRRGMPIMRHMVLVAPEDREATGRHDQFLFGPDLLAAPVLEPGATARSLHLPAGTWVDLWRSGTWDSAAGAFVLAAASRLDGPGPVTVPAPLEELPLFVRAGAVLPLLPADVDTLADYGAGIPGLVRLADRRDRLVLLAFPRGDTTATLFERRERVRSRETRAGWELAIRGARRRTWEITATLATLERPITPCEIRWGARPLAASAWSWDDDTQVLRAAVTGRQGRLVVRACES